MTTLKLTKKPTGDTPARPDKAPARRGDPSKRDRTVAPKAFAKQASVKNEHAVEVPARREEKISSKTSQRNHRYDGSLRDEAPRSSSRPISRPKIDDTGRDTPRRGGKIRDGFEPGEFNNDRASNPMFSPKPIASDPDNPRLSKRMAELGLCSRREADEWIINGWVKVNGKIIDELGTRVSRDEKIEISKQAEKYQSEIVTILLNKPIGYVSGQAEDGYEPAIVLIHPDNQWKDDPLLHHAQPREFKRGYLK